MTEDKDLAEFAELRAAYRARLDTLSARHPLPNVEGWSCRFHEEAQRASLAWGIAFELRFLPECDEFSGLMLIAPVPGLANVRWASRSGLFMAPEPLVSTNAGELRLDERASMSLRTACHRAWKRGLADVPPRCYDGIPATFVLHRAGLPQAQRATCNVSDGGIEPAACLARAVMRSLRPAHPGGT
jgi:hypothetical protein